MIRKNFELDMGRRWGLKVPGRGIYRSTKATLVRHIRRGFGMPGAAREITGLVIATETAPGRPQGW